MSAVLALPRRSITVAFQSAFVSLLRWLILVVIALLSAPYVLAPAERAREHATTAHVLRQSGALMRQAGGWLGGHVPTWIAGKDRTGWILMAKLSMVAIGADSSRDGIVNRVTARQLHQAPGRWRKSMQLGEDTRAAAAFDEGFKRISSTRGASM